MAWCYPRSNRVRCLNELERMLAAAEAEQGLAVGSLDVMPIIETARGVESAKKIATADSRIKRMAFGGGDYTLDLNYEWEADEAVLSYARAKAIPCLTVGRSGAAYRHGGASD